MSKKGAELVANGMYTKHLLEKVKTAGKRGLPEVLLVSAIILAHCVGVGLELGITDAKQCLGPGVNPSNVSSMSESDLTSGEGGIQCPQNS
jgi:hypothetical protein